MENSTQKEPLVSLVMASYGNAQYIKSSIESVLNQSYQNWELVVVDDCSPDNSNNVVKPFLVDERIKLFYHEENQGLGAARNTGVKECAGEIVACLDPDDELLPDAIQWLVEVYSRFPEASTVIGGLEVMDANGNRLNKQITYADDFRVIDNVLLEKVIGGWMSFRKHLYDQTEGYSRQLRSAEDQDLLFNLGEVGKAVASGACKYLYRNVATSLSRGKNQIYTTKNHIKSFESAGERRGGLEWKVKKVLFQKKYTYYRFLAIQEREEGRLMKSALALATSLLYLPWRYSDR